MIKWTVLIFTLIFQVAVVSAQTTPVSIEGHRGARGYLPENTIPSFILAIEQGADTIEIDVVVSKDKKVVVSHEPWFASTISTAPNGSRIAKETEREHNIYKLTYEEVKKYDVGAIGNKDFPEQVPLPIYKPLLTDVFAAIEKYTKDRGIAPVRYNIEIKSNPQGDDVFHPGVEEFVELVLRDIADFGLEKRVIVQSFDVRPLQIIKKKKAAVELSYLVSNLDGIEKNIEKLGFVPDTYSPHYSLLTKELAKYCRDNGMKLVPWTVNALEDLKKVKEFAPDAVITDYPDRAVKVFRVK